MPRTQKLTGADYLLLLLYLNNQEPIFSAVRLTKMIFLFEKEIVPLLKKKGMEISDKELPDFTPYNYGPFSKDVYEQLELFQSIGFLKVQNLKSTEEMAEADDWEEPAFIDELYSQEVDFDNRRDGKLMKYELLSRGAAYVEQEIIGTLLQQQISILSDFKARITTTSIKSLLRYVYTKYPEMTENSLIRDEVLGNEE